MKEGCIIKKIKRSLWQAHQPDYLHHYGPKTYLFWKHFFCLLVKQSCKMSYERVSGFLRDLGFSAPTPSALCKCLKRLTVRQLELLLQATNEFKKTLVAATDGLYFSQNNPSLVYLKRIKRGLPRKNTQSVAVYDTRRKRWLAVQTRRKSIGEYKLAKIAMKKLITIICTLVADKGFDINKFYEFLKKKRHQGHYTGKKRSSSRILPKPHAKVLENPHISQTVNY